MKAKSLQDLQAIAGELAQARRDTEAARAKAQAERAKREAEVNLFSRAAGPVKPLPSKDKVQHPPELPQPVPVQRLRDEQAVLQSSLSDEFDITTLLQVDETMSYRAAGIGHDVTRKLRQGHWSIQGEVDLHGLRREEAREALAAFLRRAVKQGWRCVRVVHGKGLGSPGKEPVLKAKVQGWLVQKQEVLAFVQARPADGGAGALVVLLRGQAT